MSVYIHKSHNVTVLLYHLVCPAKYRRVVFDDRVETTLKDICLEISKRYALHFLEIGVDGDHVHFLIQSIPTYPPTKIARTVKSITAREIFKQIPSIRKIFWGGEFWSDGHYISTVGKHGSETVISNYVKNQGGVPYKKIYTDQMKLWE